MLANPTVKATIAALQRGDRSAWAAEFTPTAALYDDGKPRSIEAFTRDAIGHEHFKSIERVSADGLEVIGDLHTEQWGDFKVYLVFLPIWFVGAFVNAAIGVSHDYTVAAEATVFLVVFGVPAAVALAISWALRRSTRGSPRQRAPCPARAPKLMWRAGIQPSSKLVTKSSLSVMRTGAHGV